MSTRSIPHRVTRSPSPSPTLRRPLSLTFSLVSSSDLATLFERDEKGSPLDGFYFDR
uniref:Uncharacterized protein n=1 Tax=Kalanchoe fedtschenkoi TaxID=63787 RepID=A0A7N0UVC4_KALFE